MGEALSLFRQAMRNTGRAAESGRTRGENVPERIPPPPMLAPFVPDYAAFCPGYYRSCETCPDYLREETLFCARWNRTYPENAVELPFDMEEFLKAAEEGREKAYLWECEHGAGRTPGAWWNNAEKRKR